MPDGPGNGIGGRRTPSRPVRYFSSMHYDITSPGNERIKRLVRLRERKSREAEGVFLVEGPRLVARAIESGLTPIETYVDGSAEVGPGGPVVTVHPEVLSRASYRRRSEGVIAVFPQPELTLQRLSHLVGDLYLVTEGLEKPGNLGAILRTADACGAAGLITVGDKTDVWNPNALRASTGAIFSVTVAQCSLLQLGEWLTAHAIDLVGGAPTGGLPYWEADLTGSLALIVGAEDRGLSRQAMSMCTRLVSIPMAGQADSLNASISIALLAFEALRQRRSSDR